MPRLGPGEPRGRRHQRTEGGQACQCLTSRTAQRVSRQRSRGGAAGRCWARLPSSLTETSCQAAVFHPQREWACPSRCPLVPTHCRGRQLQSSRPSGRQGSSLPCWSWLAVNTSRCACRAVSLAVRGVAAPKWSHGQDVYTVWRSCASSHATDRLHSHLGCGCPITVAVPPKLRAARRAPSRWRPDQSLAAACGGCRPHHAPTPAD